MDKTLSLGLIVIGDEILSGRTKDTNINTIACFCEKCGIELKEVRVIPDDQNTIIETVNALRTKYSYVFTTGGIGGTHDDITAESIAKAFNRPFVINDEATNIIQEHYKENLTNTRMSMAYMPENVSLIQNPVSKVPSFYIENVFVLAGMPSVMKGMLSDIETKIEKGIKKFTNSITSSALEGVIGEELAKIQENHPSVSIGSYPFYNPPNIGSTIVLRSVEKNEIKIASKKIFNLIKQFDQNPHLDLQVKIN